MARAASTTRCTSSCVTSPPLTATYMSGLPDADGAR
jgi:hypothetical protein